MKQIIVVLALLVAIAYSSNDTTWVEVKSKEITKIGYDYQSKALSVVYVGGDTLTYLNVKRKTFIQFKKAVNVDAYNYKVSSTHVMKK